MSGFLHADPLAWTLLGVSSFATIVLFVVWVIWNEWRVWRRDRARARRAGYVPTNRR